VETYNETGIGNLEIPLNEWSYNTEKPLTDSGFEMFGDFMNFLWDRLENSLSGDIVHMCWGESYVDVRVSIETSNCSCCPSEYHTEDYIIPYKVLLSGDDLDDFINGEKRREEQEKRAREEKAQEERARQTAIRREESERKEYERLKDKFGEK
jgi:hypothetical protein